MAPRHGPRLTGRRWATDPPEPPAVRRVRSAMQVGNEEDAAPERHPLGRTHRSTRCRLPPRPRSGLLRDPALHPDRELRPPPGRKRRRGSPGPIPRTTAHLGRGGARLGLAPGRNLSPPRTRKVRAADDVRTLGTAAIVPGVGSAPLVRRPPRTLAPHPPPVRKAEVALMMPLASPVGAPPAPVLAPRHPGRRRSPQASKWR